MVKLLSWVKRWFFGEPDSSSVVSCPGTDEDQGEPEIMTPALPKGGLFNIEEDQTEEAPEEVQIGDPAEVMEAPEGSPEEVPEEEQSPGSEQISAAASSDKNDHLIEAPEEPEPEPEPGSLEAWKREQLRKLRGR